MQGLWPVLGTISARRHSAGDTEIPLARWAIRALAGPRPAFRGRAAIWAPSYLRVRRVGGCARRPARRFETRIREWAPRRAGAAATARAARGRTAGEDILVCSTSLSNAESILRAGRSPIATICRPPRACRNAGAGHGVGRRHGTALRGIPSPPRRSVPRLEKDRFPDHRWTSSMTPPCCRASARWNPSSFARVAQTWLVGHLFREALLRSGPWSVTRLHVCVAALPFPRAEPPADEAPSQRVLSGTSKAVTEPRGA